MEPGKLHGDQPKELVTQLRENIAAKEFKGSPVTTSIVQENKAGLLDVIIR